MDKRERVWLDRLVALEGKFAAEAEGAEAAAAQRRWDLLNRLQRQAAVLRNNLIADGIVAVTEGGDVAEEDACWAGLGEDNEEGGGGAIGGGGDGNAAEELVINALARYALATSYFFYVFLGSVLPLVKWTASNTVRIRIPFDTDTVNRHTSVLKQPMRKNEKMPLLYPVTRIFL